MKLWITRDGNKGEPTIVIFWTSDPGKLIDGAYDVDGYGLFQVDCSVLEVLTDIPLPRRGSKRLVNAKIEITPCKRKDKNG